MSHCYSSFGCSSCHQRRVIGTQNHPSLQVALGGGGARYRATLHAEEMTKAGSWRMERSWTSAAATGRVDLVVPGISPLRGRKGHRNACLKGQINRESGTVRTLRRGWWMVGTWRFLREGVEVTLGHATRPIDPLNLNHRGHPPKKS